MEINAGSVGLPTRVKGSIRPIRNRVIVDSMEFGEQTTAAGLIISSDDGKDRGIKPRWGRVVVKGNENVDPYQVGTWILIEHGRWTRGFEVELEDGTIETMRTVEAESIIGWQEERPQNTIFGDKHGAGDVASVRPEDFGAGA